MYINFDTLGHKLIKIIDMESSINGTRYKSGEGRQ